MDRRTFIKGTGAAIAATGLSAPAFAQTPRDRTLYYCPAQGGVQVLDLLVNISQTTSGHAYCVFDTLYGSNSQYQPSPQMVEGHTSEDNDLTWTFKLRPGLKFHDGEPVLTRDVIASIRRYMQRDPYSVSLEKYTNELVAVDDRTFRFRLKKRFPILMALGHPMASPIMIMPERIAQTPASKPITEMIGSGPYRFIANEFEPGVRANYQKFEGYIPRNEAPDMTSGGKHAYFDRIEWKPIKDASTAASALQTGEIDWWEVVTVDLAPMLRRDPNIKLYTGDPMGFTGFLRFNMVQPPFNNPKLRNILLRAMVQEDAQRALMGDELDRQKTCYAFFSCQLPGVKQVAEKVMAGKKDYAALGKEFRDAGYKGEKITLVAPVDVSSMGPLGPVVADVMKKMGINVDLQSIDFQSFVAKRNNKEMPEKGGWTAFVSSAPGSALSDPIVGLLIRALGPIGYPGWYESERVEKMVVEWTEAENDTQRHEILNRLQDVLVEDAPIVPLGNHQVLSAFRKDITGFLPGPFPILWNLKRG